MAEIVLKIPKEFEQDFNTDKFKECFECVLADCKAWDYAGLSGNYEHEKLEMLLDAFNEAVVLPKGHGRLIDANEVGKYVIIGNANLRKCPTIIEADKEEK